MQQDMLDAELSWGQWWQDQTTAGRHGDCPDIAVKSSAPCVDSCSGHDRQVAAVPLNPGDIALRIPERLVVTLSSVFEDDTVAVRCS